MCVERIRRLEGIAVIEAIVTLAPGVERRGGTSRVMRVMDERSGQHFALKQAFATSASSDDLRATALFRQEYHVLSQLKHPNVVETFEYGYEDARPYYTMELLDGASVHDLAPLGWRTVCSILLDLCSPLSMLHARRFVHCDVTARNVFITNDGVTKLIDFGALAAMDHPTTTLAGTPPYMTPELVRRQSFDGRVDFFALGALAYWTLSGKHAYPARTIYELEIAWNTSPTTLTELGLDVPVALDRLILSLLNLECEARPTQLAEIVYRLSTLLGTQRPVASSAVHAQIATPKLVGREDALRLFRNVREPAATKRSEIVCISGPKGVGRSRLLEACALEAILAGDIAIKLGCKDGSKRPFGLLARTIQAATYQDARLIEVFPEATRDILRNRDSTSEAQFSSALERISPETVRHFANLLSSERQAVLLIDDLGEADVSSIQALLTLVDGIKHARLVLVTTIGSGDTKFERDVGQLLKSRRHIRLRPLAADETLQLLRSLFGDPLGIDRLAEWIHRVGSGVPRASVELAQHGVESGIVTYVDGQFTIAARIETAKLPTSFEQTAEQRITMISELAREALGALSLVTPFGPLSNIEQLELLCAAGWSQVRVLEAFDELQDSRLIVVAADGRDLASDNILGAAAAALGPSLRSLWHGRLATTYEKRGHSARLLAILHHEYAGNRDKAYRELLTVDADLRGTDDPNIRFGNSLLGIELHRKLLAHAIASGAPRVEAMHLRRVLLNIGALSDPSLGVFGAQTIKDLREDSGLAFLDETDPALGEHEQLLACLARAHERFLVASAGERLPVFDAISQFAQAVSAQFAIVANTRELDSMPALVELLRPLRTLAPGLAFVHSLLDVNVRALTQGGRENACWVRLLTALEQQPELLPELVRAHIMVILHFHIGCNYAVAGDDRFKRHAEYLAASPRTEVQASSLRLLNALAHGSMQEAARHRRDRAISALASGHDDQLLTISHVAELSLLDACGDILGLQQAATWFEERGTQYPGWLPFATMARAASLLLCDQNNDAELLLTQASECAQPLRHSAWYALAGLRAEAALQSGKLDEARDIAEAALRTAQAAGLDMTLDIRPQRILALAVAKLGNVDQSLAQLDLQLRAFEVESSETVHAGQLFETRARVALLCSDRASFDKYYSRVRAIYKRGAYPGLVAKLHDLEVAANKRPVRPSPTMGQSLSVSSWRNFDVSSNALDHTGGYERCAYLLTLLLNEDEAGAGHLYTEVVPGKFVCVATRNTHAADDALDASVNLHALQRHALEEDVTLSLIDSETDDTLTRELPESGLERYRVIGLRTAYGKLTGIALVRLDSSTGTPSYAPGLCAFIADVLSRISLSN